MTALLETEGLTVHHGELLAVSEVSLSVDEGETLAVIGANGAGKSTLLGALAGSLLLTKGEIRLDGTTFSRLPAHRRVAGGIALTPEGRRIFPSLTVAENLMVGAYRRRPGPWDISSVCELFPLVADRLDRLGGNLSGGEQQATAIGRSLMSNPRLLLLDEASLGLAPVAVQQIYNAIPHITERGTTVLVVEQDLTQALRVADRVHCLLEGRTVLEGRASEVSRNDVAAAYFGIEPAGGGGPWSG